VSFLFRAPRQRRQLQFVNPPIPPNSAVSGYGGPPDLSRVEASLQKIAVWACVNLVATIAETMPVDQFVGKGTARRQMDLAPWLEDPDGTGHGTGDWLYQYVFSKMLRGNAYGITLARDPMRGTPTQIMLQHPDRVRVRLDEDGRPDWTINGRPVDRGRMWHRRVFPVPGEMLGLSPIELHSLTIGLGLSSLRFGAQWFHDGAHPSGILSNSELDMANKTQADTAKARFMAAIRGTREPVVLGKGWTFKAIQVAPNESQFLETNNYTSAECCNIFGPGFASVFGYSTGGSLTYTNVEQRSLDLLTYAADPWLVRIERTISRLLPPGQEIKFNRRALVKTDLLTRYRAHEIALRNDWMVVNEVRDVEDQQPVPWGDKPIENKKPIQGRDPEPEGGQ